LKLLGRAKNMIVTAGGKNVYPEDIENAFADLEGVEEFSVFAANFIWPTGSMVGEQLVLVLRPEADLQVNEAFLTRVRLLNEKLSEYKRVHGIVVMQDEFPRTASQKIKREELARRLGAATKREEAVLPF
jgi:long-chain acyl-CoA synthetase